MRPVGEWNPRNKNPEYFGFNPICAIGRWRNKLPVGQYATLSCCRFQLPVTCITVTFFMELEMKKTNYETKILSHGRNSAESGRSMVEMLGVLAIVGVISIGGIAGYIYGMNRYRTNEILDGGNKRAVLVASQLASEITPNLTEFVDYDETAGGTFSSDVEVWENEFGIQVSGVKKEVCENLIRMIGDNTPLRGLVNVDGEGEDNLAAGECAEGTNNKLYLVYNLEMLSKQAVPSGSRNLASDNSKPKS